MTKVEIQQLQKRYIHITSCAAEEMSKNVTVRELRFSVLCLPPNLRQKHKKFVKRAKADVKEAESIDDIFYVVGDHCDFLNYSLLEHLIDLYGSNEIKEEMADYVKRIKAFRGETRLKTFSEVYKEDTREKPGNIDKDFSVVVTKHEMDWTTATLEDVEKFRNDVCCELSLYTFSLNLVAVARGCVEITWQVPHSLVPYIQKMIKPSSSTMRKHHVSILTIDGFIAYDSTVGTYFIVSV